MYQPGINPLVSSKEIVLGQVGGRRRLTDDEFAYYYQFAQDEAFDYPTRTGIAIVLKADLIKLYEGAYEYFKDQLLDHLSLAYESLEPQQKQKADSEIYAFEKYLIEPLPAQSREEQKAGARRLWFFKKQIELEKEEVEEEARQKEYEKQRTQFLVEKAKRPKEQEKLKIEWDKFIRNNMAEFLHALYVEHPIINVIDENLSALELKLRTASMGLVQAKKINGNQLLRVYADGLNILSSGKNLVEIDVELNKLINKYDRSHPLSRLVLR